MKYFIILLFSSIYLLGCSSNDLSEYNNSEDMKLTYNIEYFGRSVAKEIRSTAKKIAEESIDYSNIHELEELKNIFFDDWYRLNSTMAKMKGRGVKELINMTPEEFHERYKNLTKIQIKYIEKIIEAGEQSKSYSNFLENLLFIKDEIDSIVPEFERERLLYVISVLYYGVQEICHLENIGLIPNTFFNNHKYYRIKSRSEYSDLGASCIRFLATTWTIAVGEPTLTGEIVAAVATVVVGGILMYEVITCGTNASFCIDKYTQCTDDPELGSNNSGGTYGTTACGDCLRYCMTQGVWNCPKP